MPAGGKGKLWIENASKKMLAVAINPGAYEEEAIVSLSQTQSD
jgi:hypothetical protein